MASPTAAACVGSTTTESERERDSKPKKERPCDACRKRKSRCVMKDGAKICVLCEFHDQECTFLQTPLPRKRKLNGEAAEEKGSRRWKSSSRSPEREQLTTTISSARRRPSVRDYADLKGPSLLKKTLGLQSHRHSRYIGPTTELEPYVLRLATFDKKDEGTFAKKTLRRVNDRDLFLMRPDEGTQNNAEEVEDLDAIEALVVPHGPALITLYFRIIHPSFPILHKRVYLEKYERTYREFSPPLLAAVYILALNWWSYSSTLADLSKPDVKTLEKLALKTMGDVIHRPKLSTVQAGLLLLQRPEGDSWSLTPQLMVIGHGLGLHLDCSNWKIPRWELGLRRRLAWGLYMQDKWSSLIYGRPSQINSSNWAVKPVSEVDFPENAADEDEEEGSTEVEKGMILFTQMIGITRILSEILETFYSLGAIEEVEEAGSQGLNLVLERAKPVQIKMREWHSKLPDCLRMDNTKLMKLSSTGYLHLAYFATEITLHRCIIRTLFAHPESTLAPICRSAARTRLVSAISFVQTLRAEHLQSFWYFASQTNLAIIATFGALLWVTSEEKEEAEFYKTRLGEYKWVLRVSSKGVEFMQEAMTICDASTGLLNERWGGPPRRQSHDTDVQVQRRRVQRAPSDHYDVEPGQSQTANNIASHVQYRQQSYPASSAFLPPSDNEEYSFDHSSMGSIGYTIQQGQEMQVSPSDTTSGAASEVYETNMDFYDQNGAGGHNSYGFLLEGQGDGWVEHVMASGIGRGDEGHL